MIHFFFTKQLFFFFMLRFLFVVAVLCLFSNGETNIMDAHRLDPGSSVTAESIPQQAQLYYFEKGSVTPPGLETLIIRVVRQVHFTDSAEVLRICFSQNVTPTNCYESKETFEFWLEFAQLPPNTTFYIGVYARTKFPYTIHSCVSSCVQTCPNDCNGQFVIHFSLISLLSSSFFSQWWMCGRTMSL